jgi:hypothetical protein
MQHRTTHALDCPAHNLPGAACICWYGQFVLSAICDAERQAVEQERKRVERGVRGLEFRNLYGTGFVRRSDVLALLDPEKEETL